MWDWWRALTIRRKLQLGFAGLLLPLIMQGGAFVVLMERVRDSTQRMSELSLEERRLAELQVLILNQIRLQKNYVLSGDPRYRQEGTLLRQEAQTLFEQLIAQAQRLKQADWLAIYQVGVERSGRYDASYRRLVEHVERGEQKYATRLTLEESDAVASEMLKDAALLVDLAHTGVDAERHATADMLGNARLTLSLISTGTLALALIVAALLSHQIGVPLQGAALAAETIASGDLRQEILVSSHDEVGRLQQAMSEMQRRLASVILEVRGGVSSVASASAQVASTAQSLADGTGQQAASVTQTSASLEQIDASIHQSAAHAARMESKALSGADAAEASGRAVAETLEDMRAISKQTAIVDEIAHQTNMLALNAAIEASRAGEHGRGFAVVSAEIRRLAERSREAASEISRVAAQSVQRAERSGEMLDELVPLIRTTAQLVQEVTASAREQTIGVGQVTQAISLVDRVTQQNAKSAEELAATADVLASQSESLNALCRYFRTREESTAAPSIRTGETAEAFEYARADELSSNG